MYGGRRRFQVLQPGIGLGCGEGTLHRLPSDFRYVESRRLSLSRQVIGKVDAEACHGPDHLPRLANVDPTRIGETAFTGGPRRRLGRGVTAETVT